MLRRFHIDTTQQYTCSLIGLGRAGQDLACIQPKRLGLHRARASTPEGAEEFKRPLLFIARPVVSSQGRKGGARGDQKKTEKKNTVARQPGCGCHGELKWSSWSNQGEAEASEFDASAGGG